MNYTIKVAIILLLLGSCSENNHSVQKKRFVVGVSIDTKGSERWQKDKMFLIEKLHERGAEIVVDEPQGDDHLQLEQVNEMIAKGIHILIIVPVNSRTATVIVENAHRHNVKVIAYDRLIQYAHVDIHVSFDNEKVGELQALYLLREVPKGRYAIIGGAIHDNNSYHLKKGQMKILKPLADKGEIDIVFDDWAQSWTSEEGKRLCELSLSLSPSIDAIVAPNDDIAEGVLSALATHDLIGKVAVSGQDATLKACKRVLNGTQTMTVYKPIKNLAEVAAEVAYKLHFQEPIYEINAQIHNGLIEVPSILLEPIGVDESNIYQTVVYDGFITPSELEN
ncbi:MAG: substrate-binding domain-containing protein [Cytophagales bacterium]|nr:substrate-binding domain-containing protein [Cytophagales bacterium]MDW8384557.1 substrate-binding domain-containing protein [Flammeovirgaceae bacterium]